jgi:hypothetical protein
MAQDKTVEVGEAFGAGRRVGLGIAALALSLVSFLSLLGVEKAILAIALGLLAARGSARATLARRLGIAAVSIGAVFIVSLAVFLIAFWGQLAELIQAIQRLS